MGPPGCSQKLPIESGRSFEILNYPWISIFRRGVLEQGPCRVRSTLVSSPKAQFISFTVIYCLLPLEERLRNLDCDHQLPDSHTHPAISPCYLMQRCMDFNYASNHASCIQGHCPSSGDAASLDLFLPFLWCRSEKHSGELPWCKGMSVPLCQGGSCRLLSGTGPSTASLTCLCQCCVGSCPRVPRNPFHICNGR